MPYEPRFNISPRLLSLVEAVAVLRERILGAAIELAWIPALQKDTRSRNVHASTAIEGNPLTLEEVRALEEGRELATPVRRSQQEVLNYFAGLRYVEKHASRKTIRHEEVLELHRILAKGVMDQGEAGRYRTIAVRVGQYLPPAPGDVSGLMFELLDWWNHRAAELSPVLSSAILHYRFEAIQMRKTGATATNVIPSAKAAIGMGWHFVVCLVEDAHDYSVHIVFEGRMFHFEYFDDSA